MDLNVTPLRWYTSLFLTLPPMPNTPPNFNELIQACSDGDLPKVLELLPTTDPTWFKSAPLRTAAQHNHTEIVLALLPHSDASVHENAALKCAIRNKNAILFDGLFSLCTAPFERNLYEHSVFAHLCVNWPEKMEIFKNTVVPQDQYNNALDLFCENTNNGGPVEITVLHRHLFKDLLEKTDHSVQVGAMKKLLSSNLELFDMLIEHHPPANCVHILEKCLEEDGSRAITLLKRCFAANVPLPTPLLSKFLEYAVDNLDWEVFHLTATPQAWKQSKAIERVAHYNDLDIYEYCVQHGAIPTEKSTDISAYMRNHELTARQITKDRVSPTALHWICTWGWNDLLPKALDCMREGYIEATTRDSLGYHKSFEGHDDNIWFSSCVLNHEYECLAQLLSYLFNREVRDSPGPLWLHQMACRFYSDPIFVGVFTKNLPAVKIDLIVSETLGFLRDSPHSQKAAELIEVFLPFMSTENRICLFGRVVNMCANHPNEYPQMVASIVAPYIKNQDITPDTQQWWDAHQAQKMNAKLSGQLKEYGEDGGAKRM